MDILITKGVDSMKPMLATDYNDFPRGDDWHYEVKYDGFRAILTINEDASSITSRNGKELLPLFPEIQQWLDTIDFKPYLPLQLDGELVQLTNEGKADFLELQWRGRLRNTSTIETAANKAPCRLLAFDLLTYKGKNVTNEPYEKRKKYLKDLMEYLDLPLKPTPTSEHLIQYIPSSLEGAEQFQLVKLFDGEGIIAKKANGLWEEGKRTKAWLKIKNWRTVHCFITALHKENGYVSLGVFHEDQVIPIGQVKNGLTAHDQSILRELMTQNAYKEDVQYYYLHPSICIAVHFLHSYDEHELREPLFSEWLLHVTPRECTWEKFIISQYIFPDRVNITSPEKPLWMIKEVPILKIEYVQYLRELSALSLPFLVQKALTTIRYPHGTLDSERFFQKNNPEYAPDFVQTFDDSEHEHILCNNIETLLWLGNQLALEFHIPFHQVGMKQPDEIVLDLDPAGSEYFFLAIKAAIEIKKVLDSLHIICFIKTSGNKGMQIHIPLPQQTFSYQETRIFTDFLGQFLTSRYPDDFTTERMKKNRGNRLYLDFVQHAEGKTIIAPYSTRGNAFAGVATPLYWDEIHEDLRVENYTLWTVPRRVKRVGCPFKSYRSVNNGPAFQEILAFLGKNKNVF